MSPAPPSPEEPEPAEDQDGCASLLMLPLLVSLGATSLLIFSGFVLNALAHFESQQFKLLWLGGSLAVGALVYHVFRRLRQKKQHNPNGGMES